VRRAWPPNVAVAQPTPAGRVIAAWPSFALIGATSCSYVRPLQRAADALPPRLLTGCRSGAAGCVLRALVAPVLPEFAVMKSAQQMRW
jgi:hypothetical protein